MTVNEAVQSKTINYNPLIIVDDSIIGVFGTKNFDINTFQKIEKKNLIIIPRESAYSEELWGETAKNGIVYIVTSNNKIELTLDSNRKAENPIYIVDGQKLNLESTEDIKSKKFKNTLVVRHPNKNCNIVLVASR